MKNKEVEKLSEPLREQQVVHLLLVKLRNSISLSSIATGDDIYEFLQVLADQNPVTLEIMQAVIDSRKRNAKPKTSHLLN